MAELNPAPRGYAIGLVRDRTPEVINFSGEPGALWYERLPREEDRSPWLRKKLMEEVGEYLVDSGPRELADVLAVLDALAVEHGITRSDLRRMADNDQRGGFLTGMMMYGRHPEYDK